jgi:hypothetical protein
MGGLLSDFLEDGLSGGVVMVATVAETDLLQLGELIEG